MMKIFRLKLSWLILLFVSVLTLASIELKATETNQEENTELVTNAKSAVLIEPTTLEVIYSKAPNEPLAPASMTKIMTLILIYEALEKKLISKDQLLTASEYASSMVGTTIYLEAGEKMSVDHLLKSLAIASANDAAVVFAEAIAGSEANFVKMMNQKAKKLGCKNTVFKNSNGLHMNGHVSSAMDIAIMASYLINNYPDVLNYTKIYEDYVRENTDKRFWLVNTNKLVKFVEGVDGLKTGWTPEAGHCMTATINKDGIRFISVIMACSNNKIRSQETLALLNYATTNYHVTPLFKRNTVVKTYEDVSLYPKLYHIIVTEDINVLSKKGEPLKKMSTEINIRYEDLDFDNKKIGTMKVYYDGKLLKEVNLSVQEEVRRASYFTILCEVLREIFLVSAI